MRASVKTKASAWVVLLAVAGLLFGAAPTLGREDGGLVQAVGEKGSICWTGGRLEAVGVGTPWEKYQSRPQAKPQATEMAHDEAFKNLLEVVGSVRVTSTATVGDLSEQSQVIQAQVRDMMRKAQPLKREYLSDGTVVERLSMPLFGGLPQLVLPREIVQMPEVRQAPSQDPGRGNEAHTGLVVDALGLSVCPALAPRILDPDGREVYGPAYVSRDFAVDQGM
ncbi:MAG: hypothetical protein KKA60_00625, partial [Proteobacteria bacterium]|nr:hypothetical protein [Pseudomonadota bacterium]